MPVTSGSTLGAYQHSKMKEYVKMASCVVVVAATSFVASIAAVGPSTFAKALSDAVNNEDIDSNVFLLQWSDGCRTESDRSKTNGDPAASASAAAASSAALATVSAVAAVVRSPRCGDDTTWSRCVRVPTMSSDVAGVQGHANGAAPEPLATVATTATVTERDAWSEPEPEPEHEPDPEPVAPSEPEPNTNVRLLTYPDMPEYLRFNPYIMTGYRPQSSFWGSLHSLLYFHNETVNIVTHAVPIVYILLVVPGALPWEKLDTGGRFLAWCHVVGSVSPWVGSVVYHTFMNACAGQTVYNLLLSLDMFGIWICQCFGALPMVTGAVHCLPTFVRTTILIIYFFVTICGLYNATISWNRWGRLVSFILPWSSRLILVACRVAGLLGRGHPNNTIHLVLQDAVSGIGGLIGALYFPEKYMPGCVDYYCNSHNIMHILTVASVYSMHRATVDDLLWISTGQCTDADLMTVRGPNEEL